MDRRLVEVVITKRFSAYSVVESVFVPGRICLFGEHSDWCTDFSGVDGKAIVMSTETGLFASCSRVKDGQLKLTYLSGPKTKLDMPIDYQWLAREASIPGNYFGYIQGAASVYFERYRWKSSDSAIINNYATTLPMKKGLSSSAAICVLTIRSLSLLNTGKQLSPEEEMELAFKGERLTPSLCGRLDQVCAYLNPKQLALVRFVRNPNRANDVQVVVEEVLTPKSPIYVLIVCLPGSKDTVKILSSLQHAARENKGSVRKLFGTWNSRTVEDVAKLVRRGDSCWEIGQLANATQTLFDTHALPHCPSELSAPNLRAFLQDDNVRNLSAGGKSVGAGGDGTVEIFVENQEKLYQLHEYVTRQLKFECWAVTVE